MTKQELFENIKRKRSFLCIGLDTDIARIPAHLMEKEDPVFEFNKLIIDATAHLCVAYKPNLAFYESMGSFGLKSFEKIFKSIIPTNLLSRMLSVAILVIQVICTHAASLKI